MWSPESEINSIAMATMRNSASASSGISSLSSCGDPDRLPELPPGDEQRLQRAALHLQQKLILREWLKEHRLQHHYSRLIAIEVAALEDVYWLEDSRASKLMGKDWQIWSQARQNLPTSKPHLDALKAQLWSTVVKSSQHQDAWTWGGMLVVSVSVAGLVTLAAMTQPALAPEARHSLLQYVTGKYLLPANCKVIWDWTDPHRVGGTMCFQVRFFQRNGQPYPICDTDQFFVEVTEGTRKVVAISELGSSTDPNNANVAKVKFTVRTAGQYKISIMIGSNHIPGSPFTKTFVPGSIDARRSRFIRPASTVVCCAGAPTLLHIEPRDEFGNGCVFTADEDPVEGYKVEIFDLNGAPVEKLCRAISFTYDKVNSRIAVTALFPEPICLKAVISFQNQRLPNGDFDIIVLSSSDTTLVHKNIASRKHNICYEAKLLSIFGQPRSKPRKVLCYVGPKQKSLLFQVTIKEMILKFIPKRIATFRLCPSTKFHFLPHSTMQTYGPVFIIDDGSQPKIELASKDRNIIAATFTHFLLKNIGGSETFKDKQDFFYHEVRKFHSNYYHEKLSLKVNREKIFESSWKATKGFSISDWCGNFEVTFQGEQGIDWGGLRREWFELICSALFDPRGGLFCAFHDKQQALVHPNANRPPHLKLKHYEFAGKIVGKCLYESALGGTYRQLVRARFTRSFLAQLIGLRVHYKYFEQDDPDLYLSKIKYILDTDLDTTDSLEVYFVEEVYDVSGQLTKTIELIPNGSKVRVTNATKNQYLDALAQQRLCNNVREEIDSFLKGLNGIIPDNLLSIFDENELELLMCGTGEYSIADFRAHHIVNGNSAEFRRVLGWFWAAVSNFSQTEMARLLQFTTGCSQLPPGGFQELNPRFQITAAPTFGSLPTAHTCFNQLCLPDYESYEQFEKALLLSISEGSEGFGMV
ncbi:apoptosis-resistant E3 ubiquitin protein ligase 1 isoform X4 [Hermetia illucens]|uniref:apoptosis-resistant E3 ubiquitin protein ligase 1 isoform X4 n=1 Tax=Hermetia illucens TaxID=343691 RepID=UPI0018CC316E|nr:apoptosis-resistant E3 ubiquitin protein ligase 1 isoform X4 [Hermetia illucens]XP_037926274.1 apoptosis-resistant E3 ubiquitin protein ligase 1 isoform X4 [Hermetia illucens]XP_037926275.1 apoptosis-resistant E3 ubiquitin protein ligase 1 isoform X4 [Hermetia illucens]XP_037926276.1 apoptosis-resistant E3 ubiquitin protein ligase 1 isoform X4 [Hermetia illucens]